MLAFAPVFRVGAIEHDLIQLIGLLMAGAILGLLLAWKLRSGPFKGQSLISVLAVLGIGAIGWSAIEAGIRLCHALAEQRS